jgi:uncharacterized spore protein YtfJ
MDVTELLSKVGDHLSVGRAFGPAYERDGTLVIPVALVAGGGGGGGGERGPAHATEVPPESDAEANRPDSPKSSSGGGFGGVVMPVGVYVVTGERVRWVPAVNVTAIALASLGLLRMVASSRAKAERRSR